MSSYTVPRGLPADKFFADLPSDATEVRFSESSSYPRSEGDIKLPRGMIVIDGCGASMNLGPDSNGFTNGIEDQEAAMRNIESRYTIKNFDKITGGKYAVKINATIGSEIQGCELVTQSECAIEMRFAMLSKVENVKITNPLKNGIYLGDGDWQGSTWANSARNSSLLERVRVYNRATSNRAFEIRQSNNVRMLNCVSEGGGPDYDLVLSCGNEQESKPAGNSVVKGFVCDGFHVEHPDDKPSRTASVLMNMPSAVPTTFRQCYWNGRPKTPIFEYVWGMLLLKEIGWWTPDHIIASRVGSPHIRIRNSHKDLDLAPDRAVRNNRCGVFAFSRTPLDGFKGLNVMYVYAGLFNN